MIAASATPIMSGNSGKLMFSVMPIFERSGPEAMNPAVNSSESPGRKKPISRPVSAKMIAKMPKSPTFSIQNFGSSTPPAARMVPSIRSIVVGAPGPSPSGGLGLVPLAPPDAGAPGRLVGEAAEGAREPGGAAVRRHEVDRRE